VLGLTRRGKKGLPSPIAPARPAGRQRAPSLLPSDDHTLTGAELERATRILQVRSRREASSVFTGGYRSAFRGSGVEFDESRPYVPGDDVRSLDWNALARTGTPYVKRFREERDQTVWLVVDVSASMKFGSVGRAKATAAAHAASLVTAAATRAGDRVGLLTFDEAVREEIPAARGAGHGWDVIRSLLATPAHSGGATRLEAALARMRSSAARRSIVFVFSDFRDDAFFGPAGEGRAPRAELVALTRRHDVVGVIVSDPREEEIPNVGAVTFSDPERPGRPLVLSTSSRRARERYHTACLVRQRALVRRLRSDGADALSLRTDRDPLRALARFFQTRPASLHGRSR